MNNETKYLPILPPKYPKIDRFFYLIRSQWKDYEPYFLWSVCAIISQKVFDTPWYWVVPFFVLVWLQSFLKKKRFFLLKCVIVYSNGKNVEFELAIKKKRYRSFLRKRELHEGTNLIVIRNPYNSTITTYVLNGECDYVTISRRADR